MSFPSHRLSTESVDRAILTLGRFQSMVQRRDCEKIVAVATSAVREADNGGDFIERARRELGLNVRIISAKDEARLIYLGVRHAMDLKGGPNLILDIGGGSVEFIVGDHRETQLLESRKLGAARMTAKFIHNDTPTEREIANLLKHYDTELDDLCTEIFALSPVKAIGTSGTIENLATMCSGGRLNEAAPTLERDALDDLVKVLLRSRSKDRVKIPGIDEKRQDQIIAGALLVQQIMKRLSLKRLNLCRSALREGILVDYISRHVPDLAIRRNVPDPRRRSVLDLARRSDWNEVHSLHVAHITLRLFDQLRDLHGLDNDARQLIEYGAMLHDIGWHISAKGHHKHSMYLVLNGNLKDFTSQEVQIIANLARYHRKAPPTLDHPAFAALSKSAQQIVCVGGSLLRIADGLDRSHCRVVNDVKCKIGKRRIRINLLGKGDMQLELWAARRKTDLFKEVFNRQAIFNVQ